MLGELFPGRKLQDEGGEDADGQVVDPWDIDLDSGVVRLRPLRTASKPAVAPKPASSSQPAPKPDSALGPDPG